MRVDSFLSRQLRNYTPWRLHRMVVAGLVAINNVPAEGDQRVHRGQQVSIRLVEPPDKLLSPSQAEFGIVFEDPWLLVIDKPADLVVHPVGDFSEDTLSNAVQFHLDQQTVSRGLLRPGIVHRLDRMTSGLIVVAKDHLSHRHLSIDFQKGRPSKTYLALVEGSPDFDSRTINMPIGQYVANNSVLMSAKPDAKQARDAKTDVRILQRWDSHALVECRLYTGRNHQIRVHLAEIGHPVLGDEYYGPGGIIRQAPRLDGDAPTAQRHALHASRLSFQHPVLQCPLSFTSSPPLDFWTLMTPTSPARPPDEAEVPSD
ncbi:MAG: RluA family pseudouridine synthase [Planctomycetaceae bacterium]